MHMIKVGNGNVIEYFAALDKFSLSIGKLTSSENYKIMTLSQAKEFLKVFGVGEIFEIHLRPLKISLTYNEWMTFVKETFDANISTPMDSIIYNWKEAYESGWSPEEAIEDALGS